MAENSEKSREKKSVQIVPQDKKVPFLLEHGSVVPLVKEDVVDYDFDPFVNRNLPHPTTDFETLAHLLKGSLGSGILAMPLAFSNAGLMFGLVATILIGTICTYCVHILVKCAHILCRRTRIPSLSFAEIAEVAFLAGPRATQKYSRLAKFLINLFLVIDLLGCCCVYLVFVARNTQQVVEFYYRPGWDIELYILATYPFILLMNVITNLKYLAPLSMVANCFIAVSIGITFYYIFQSLPHFSSVPAIAPIEKIPLFFGTVIFALEGIGVVMSLENNMENPTHFIGCPSVLNFGMAIVVLLYTTVGFFGYLRFGADTEGSITLNLPQEKILYQSVKLMIALAILITYSLQFYVPVEIIWKNIRKSFPERERLMQYVFRFFLSSLTVMIAVLVPNLGGFISLVGAVCLSMLGLIFPAVIELVTIWEKPGLGRYKYKLWKNLLLILFGLIGFILGTHLNEWISVIGLEIHAQINTQSKLFSKSRNESDSNSPVNTNVNYFDAAIPGTLPVLNKASVEAAIRTGLALSCDINLVSIFERKHYFYPDLPLGYQITQRSLPIASNGLLELKSGKKIRLKQIQLEQDSGKSIHSTYDNCSYIDLNRAGIPLMELVFEPDLTTAKETVELLKELILTLRYLRTCTCKMEGGALRVDANVSINHFTEPYLSGIRTEVKNIGSIRAVHDAIEYEIHRQINMRLHDREIVNETRSWSTENACTLPMRDKETKQDYRFYPEFNLPPLVLSATEIEDVKNKMPRLPNEIRLDLKNKHGLKDVHIEVLIRDYDLLMAFEKCLKNDRDTKRAANFFINEVLSVLNKNSELELTDHIISNIGSLIDLLQEQCINLNIAKKVLSEITNDDNQKTPIEVIEENNWYMIKDSEILEGICQEVLDNESNLVQIYQNGKETVLKVFKNKVATKTNQCADMRQVDQILKHLLNNNKN